MKWQCLKTNRKLQKIFASYHRGSFFLETLRTFLKYLEDKSSNLKIVYFIGLPNGKLWLFKLNLV